MTFRVTAIATGRHGRAIDPQGIDLDQALKLAAAGKKLDELSKVHAPKSWRIHRRKQSRFFAGKLTVNYEIGEPALSPSAAHWRTTCTWLPPTRGRSCMLSRTEKTGRSPSPQVLLRIRRDGRRAHLLGLPRSRPASNLFAFEGVLNSCTNLLIELMEQGNSFDEAVAYAQSIGIAETDPSGDIDGWDASIKVAALVTVLMDTPYKPQQVERQGIRDLSRPRSSKPRKTATAGSWSAAPRKPIKHRHQGRSRNRHAPVATVQCERH